MKELKDVLKDAVGFELKTEKRYVIFIDPSLVDIKSLVDHPEFMADIDAVIIPCSVDKQQAMRDAISVYELEPEEVIQVARS